MKKLLVILLCIAFALSIGACSDSTALKTGDTDTPDDKGSDTSAQEKVTIDFWYSLGGKNGEIIKGMVDNFNTSQSEIEVRATFQGDYYENHAKVLAAIASNTQPDVTMVEIASIGAFADAGALEELKPYVEGKDGTNYDDYIEGLTGNSYWKDKLYAIPFNRSTPILYINKGMLEKAGIDPNGPKTWEELEEFSRTLTKKAELWGFSTPVDIWFYEALVFQNGGNILSTDGKQPEFNSKEGIEPVEFWKGMIKEGIMKMPPGEKYNAWEVANQDFINQKVAMIFTSTGYLNSLMEQAEFEVGTAFLPAKKSFGVPTGGTNLVMLSKTPDKEKLASWKFIKWMTEEDQTTHFSVSTGYMPVRTSAAQSSEMEKLYKEKPQFKVAVDQLEYAKPRPMVPGYKELQEIIMAELQRAIIDDSVTAEDALNTASDKSKKLLK